MSERERGLLDLLVIRRRLIKMVWTGVEVALLRFVLIFQLSPAISRVSSASIQDGFDSVWPPSGPAKEMLPSKTSSSEKGTHEETLNSASSRYLLGVYNRLRVGESLLQATGEQSVKPLAVLHSDTVRTLKATGKSTHALSFRY